MKTAVYARVSTKDQDPGLQLVDLRTYCKRRGLEVFQEYMDVGVSGAKDKRPALDHLMDDARKRKFDIIAVWRFDRFARSTRHLVNALAEFRSLGIAFVSYQENIDTSSPMGEAMFAIIGAMAQLERDIIMERVQAGVRRAREKGKTLGRPRTPVDSERAGLLRSQGRTIREIARELDAPPTLVHRALRARSENPGNLGARSAGKPGFRAGSETPPERPDNT
jgi:DNA invertase Pin-like site-specific DNA recombinase